MKDKEKNNMKDDDDRIHVSESVFQTARSMEQQRLAEEEKKQLERERILAEREKKKREAYERRLLEEKKELLRMKQGQTEESELIPQETPEEVKMSLGKKISNFFYHNKWWLGIAVLMLFIAGVLVYDLIKKENPDMIIIVTADNEYVGEAVGLQEYAEQFAGDFNDDGEVLVSVYYIPYSDDKQQNYAYGVDAKMNAMFHSDEAVIVIGGSNTQEILPPVTVYSDLNEIYPDNPHVRNGLFYLKDTDFAERIGLSEDMITDDMFIAVRKPQNKLYSTAEEIQETYDRDFPVFDAIIRDLTEN